MATVRPSEALPAHACAADTAAHAGPTGAVLPQPAPSSPPHQPKADGHKQNHESGPVNNFFFIPSSPDHSHRVVVGLALLPTLRIHLVRAKHALSLFRIFARNLVHG